MKKNKSVINSRTMLYTLVLFGINILSLPPNFSLIRLSSFEFNQDNLSACILTACVVWLFSTVYAVIIQKLVSFKDGTLAFCAMLLLADPFLRCTILNLRHLVLHIITAGLGLYLAEGKNFKFKTAFVSVFIFSTLIINIESAFTYIPVIILVYGFSWVTEKRKLIKPVYKNGNKQKAKTGNTIIRVKRSIVLLFVGLFVLATILNQKLSGFILPQSTIIYYYCSADVFFHFARFWIGALPYAGLLSLFIKNYLSLIVKGKKLTFDFVLKKASFLWSVALSYALMLIGIFVFDYASSVTVFNMISVITIILIYLLDQDLSQKAIDEFSVILRKHKIFLCAVFAVWFCLTEFLFKDVQYSLIDEIASIAGGRL